MDDLQVQVGHEVLRSVARLPGVRIDRVVSLDYSSPEGFWYDQEEHEWVLVLEGWGEIEFEDERVVRMEPGDSLTIPPRCRHRIRCTDPGALTVWLTVRTGDS